MSASKKWFASDDCKLSPPSDYKSAAYWSNTLTPDITPDITITGPQLDIDNSNLSTHDSLAFLTLLNLVKHQYFLSDITTPSMSAMNLNIRMT